MRDEEDRYFDEQEPSRTPDGHAEGPGLEVEEVEVTQNGQGDYDY